MTGTWTAGHSRLVVLCGGLLLAGGLITARTMAQMPEAIPYSPAQPAQLDPTQTLWRRVVTPPKEWGQAHAPETAKADITRVEQRLYGKTYPDDGLEARLSRVEKTLFQRSQPGPQGPRLRLVADTLAGDASRPQAGGDPGLVLDFLEGRLFQERFADEPLPHRLSRLEAAVFGEINPTLTQGQRMQRLLYSVPLDAQGIRLRRYEPEPNKSHIP